MYKHARALPRGGWLHTEVAGSVSNGPTPGQRQGIERYNAKIQAERERSIKARLQAEHLTKPQKPDITPDPWLLTVVGVPDPLVALVNRLGLKPNKAKTCWWSLFEPTALERARAKTIIQNLKQAGISFSWKQVERRTQLPSKIKNLPHQAKPYRKYPRPTARRK